MSPYDLRSPVAAMAVVAVAVVVVMARSLRGAALNGLSAPFQRPPLPGRALKCAGHTPRMPGRWAGWPGSVITR
ncbi:hypothetical protein GCM10009802_60990 [Streptomyces synnematoformans]|uniref:Uncharacterized protein n=1 Tax=Streptomyces synnematoformans TaxID=415721 RepID=A0ABP4KPJ0_9ACTN